MLRCFNNGNEIVCIDDESQYLINLTKKSTKFLLPEEIDKLIKQLLDKEIEVTEVESHRYMPRTYYTTYKISGKKPLYLMEVYDGSSASYNYYFCRSKSQCQKIMEDLEEDNMMLY